MAPGTDTVTADTLDTVGDSCENVTRTDAGNANQDKQPTVTWTAPAANTTLPTTKATTLSVNASDDKTLTKVQFLAGNRIVCEDTTAPYSCAYTPNGADSGKQVLTAIAIDSAQQTATAIRAVKIARFSPKISEKVSPSKDTKAPYRFRVTGTLTPPTGMSKSEACGAGVISTSVKAGKKTISTRRVNLKSNCTYSSTVSFANRSRFGKAKSLKLDRALRRQHGPGGQDAHEQDGPHQVVPPDSRTQHARGGHGPPLVRPLPRIGGWAGVSAGMAGPMLTIILIILLILLLTGGGLGLRGRRGRR